MVVHAGKSIAKKTVADYILAHGKKRGEPYVIRWDTSVADESSSVDRGQAFVASALDGSTIDVGSMLGKRPIVLTFWASWCAPCLAEAPHLARLYRQYQASKSPIAFVSVSIDDADGLDDLRAVVRKLDLPYPVALDPKGRALALYAKGASIPLTFVIDRSGAVIYRHGNFEAGDEEPLQRAIASVLDTSASSAPVTQ